MERGRVYLGLVQGAACGSKPSLEEINTRHCPCYTSDRIRSLSLPPPTWDASPKALRSIMAARAVQNISNNKSAAFSAEYGARRSTSLSTSSATGTKSTVTVFAQTARMTRVFRAGGFLQAWAEIALTAEVCPLSLGRVRQSFLHPSVEEPIRRQERGEHGQQGTSLFSGDALGCNHGERWRLFAAARSRSAATSKSKAGARATSAES